MALETPQQRISSGNINVTGRCRATAPVASGWAGEAPALQSPLHSWTLKLFRVTV